MIQKVYFLGWNVAWYALLLEILNDTDLSVEIKISPGVCLHLFASGWDQQLLPVSVASVPPKE